MMILPNSLNANMLVCLNFVLLIGVAMGEGAYKIKGNRPNIVIIMADDMVSVKFTL